MTSSPLNQLQVLKHQLSLFVAFHASLLSFFFFYIHFSICSSFIAQIFSPSLRLQHYFHPSLSLPLPFRGPPPAHSQAQRWDGARRAPGGGSRGRGAGGGWGAGRACWQPCEQPAGRCPAPATSRRDPPPLPPSTHPPLAIVGSPPPIAVHQLRFPATLT